MKNLISLKITMFFMMFSFPLYSTGEAPAVPGKMEKLKNAIGLGKKEKAVKEESEARIDRAITTMDKLRQAVGSAEKVLKASVNEREGLLIRVNEKIEKQSKEMIELCEENRRNDFERFLEIQKNAELETFEKRAEMKMKAKHGEALALATAKVEAEGGVAGINQRHEAELKSDQEKQKMRLEFYEKQFGKFGPFINSPQKMAGAGAFFVLMSLGFYTAKYGLPHFFEYLMQPKVVTETSMNGWFGFAGTKAEGQASFDELVFGPVFREQMNQLASQLVTARNFNESLPNLLFSGPPGTGKTACARALARLKDDKGYRFFNYAITSGSEFSKIKDLNLRIQEFRKFITWAQKSKLPIIVVIDEAELLFEDRTLPYASTITADFINAVLATIQDKSQKNICFVLVTNHAYKLDEAILDRVGKPYEFSLPDAGELQKILMHYVSKFATENKKAPVTLYQDFTQHQEEYVQKLIGCAPRAIKFIAEQMISRARRATPAVLTHEIASKLIDEQIAEMQVKEAWDRERQARKERMMQTRALKFFSNQRQEVFG